MKLVLFGSRSRSKFASSFIGLFVFFLNLVWTASTNCLSFSRFFQTLERFRMPRHVVPSRVTVYKAGRTPVHERIVNGSSDPHRERTSLSMRERDSDRTQKGCTQWPDTADVHPAIRALRLLAELLTASEPGAVEAATEKAETEAEAGAVEVVGAAAEAGVEAVGAVAALGGVRTATAFEVMMSSTATYFQLYLTHLLSYSTSSNHL